MGTLVGHVAPGLGFMLIGLWHLINHIKLHTTHHPKPYISPPWFGRLELYFIMAGSALSMAMELFVGPANHQPLDPSDGSIPSNHLHNFEHASISLSFFTYASLSLLFDRLALRASFGLSQLLAALAFGQQLLLFHLHSADHSGPEGHYHLLLQVVVFVSLLTTLLGLGFPESSTSTFLVSFVRSLSILFQGVWFVVMGFMLWTPSLIPKGCFLHYEDGHHVVRCSGEESLHRAKSLVNLQFSWFLTGIALFGVCLYVVLGNFYENIGHKVEYFSLGFHGEENTDEIDVESQKKSKSIVLSESTSNKSFINDMGNSGFVSPMDMER